MDSILTAYVAGSIERIAGDVIGYDTAADFAAKLLAESEITAAAQRYLDSDLGDESFDAIVARVIAAAAIREAWRISAMDGKVYLATHGDYDDYRVCHVFARREDAESYPLGDDVEEFEVHAGPVEVRRWYRIVWHADWADRDADGVAAANPDTGSDLRDFDGDEAHVEHRWYQSVLNVGGWDLPLVKQVYDEQRAQRPAGEPG